MTQRLTRPNIKLDIIALSRRAENADGLIRIIAKLVLCC